MGRFKFRRTIVDSFLKPKEIIRKQKVKQRHQSSRTSLFDAIRGYLTADSFMYGPLTSKTYHTPGSHRSAEMDREKRSPSKSPVRVLKDLLTSPGDTPKESNEPIQQMIDQMEETSETGRELVQGTYVSVRTTVTTTTIAADDEKGDQASGISGILHKDLETPKSVDARGDSDLTEPDDEHSWGSEGHHPGEDDFHDHIPLDNVVAEEVANQLIGSLGGRFSDDLGINVDVNDNSVECWFLAANLFSRSVSFEVSKSTYKELSDAGVSKVADLLILQESRLAAILEKTGYTKYGQRVASQLQKLATYLEANYWGRISTFKYTADNLELVRQLRNLPGVKLSAARLFLRELRGLWKGAPVEFDLKTKRAAMHLKFLGSIKAASNPERVLSEFSQSAGIDLRDLEVALFKLGSAHEHHYGECPGGSDCKVLSPLQKLIQSLPSNILL